MILDGIVGSSRQKFGDFGPLITNGFMTLQDLAILFHAPCFFANGGIQIVVPSFTTLFPRASRQTRGNLGPLLGPKLLDEADDGTVFLFGPRSLDRVIDSPPTRSALFCRATREFLRHVGPENGRVGI